MLWHRLWGHMIVFRDQLSSPMRVLLHLCLLSHLIHPAHYNLKTYTSHISCLTTRERNTAGRGQKEYKQASLASLPPFKFYPLCAQPFLTQLSICEKKSKLKNSSLAENADISSFCETFMCIRSGLIKHVRPLLFVCVFCHRARRKTCSR